ncbi:FAD-dependent oxidoreductase [Ramlibacter aurantiacus]|nr:FAD-dependent oxidoreductase [Ramlibacter aurantiacus]
MTRVAVIGAGPSGLYAAEALRRTGRHEVLVFERQARVGGMALTRTYDAPDGRRIPYDMGSGQPFSSRKLFKLIKELHLHLGSDLGEGIRPGTPCHFRFLDTHTGEYSADFLRHRLTGQPLGRQLTQMRDFARLIPWILRFRKLARPGHAHGFSPELLRMSEAEWMKACDFKLIGPLLRALSSISSHGGIHEDAADPRSLVQSLKSFVFALNPPLRYTMGVWLPVREGYQEVLTRLARRLNVMTRAEITAIRRSDEGVHITCNGQDYEFDHLIIACPPGKVAAAMDCDVEETTLYARVRNRPTWRVCFLARGIPEPRGVYVFTDQAERADAPHALCDFHCHALIEGTGTDALRLYCGIVGHDRLDGIDAALQESERLLVKVFGAHDIRWIDKVFWPQFNSHFGIEDLASGIYDQFEQLQGRNRTWYTGEYLAGNSHSMTLEYSWRLVERHFSMAPKPVRGQRHEHRYA